MGPIVISQVTGIRESQIVLNKYERNVSKAHERGIKRATKFLEKEAINVTPQATGDLRRSARSDFVGKGSNTKGFVSFNTLYAIYVHEDFSKKHASGTHAKYLSRTAFEKAGQMSRIIWEEINKVRL